MTLLKCFTLLMFESRLIKEEARRGRIFASHAKKAVRSHSGYSVARFSRILPCYSSV